MKEINNIDDLFREVVNGHEEEVPSYLWQGIQEKMKTQRRKKIIVMWRNAAAVAVILIAFGTGYFFSVNKNSNQVAEQAHDEQFQETNDVEKNIITDEPSSVASTKKQTENQIAEVDFASEENDILKQNHKVEPTREKASEKNKRIEKRKENVKKTGPAKVEENTLIAEATPNTGNQKENKASELFNIESDVEDIEIAENEIPIIDSSEINNESKNAIAESRFPIADSSIINNEQKNTVAKTAIPIADTSEIKNTDYENTVAEKILPAISDSTNTEKQDIKLHLNESLQLQDNVIAQIDDKHKRKWSIGAQFSPIFASSGPQLPSQQELADDKAFYAQPNASNSVYNEPTVKQIVTYSGGVKFSIETSDKVGFHTGVYYTQLGYQADNIYVTQNLRNGYFAKVVNTSNGNYEIPDDYIASNSTYFLESVKNEGRLDFNVPEGELGDGNSLELVEAENEASSEDKITDYYDYIDIPLLMEYKAIDKKIKLSFLGGVSPGILIGSKAYLTNNESRTQIINNSIVPRVRYNAELGLGIGVKVHKKIMLNVEPQLKYNINSLIDNSNLQSFTYGIFAGASYTF